MQKHIFFSSPRGKWTNYNNKGKKIENHIFLEDNYYVNQTGFLLYLSFDTWLHTFRAKKYMVYLFSDMIQILKMDYRNSFSNILYIRKKVLNFLPKKHCGGVNWSLKEIYSFWYRNKLKKNIFAIKLFLSLPFKAAKKSEMYTKKVIFKKIHLQKKPKSPKCCRSFVLRHFGVYSDAEFIWPQSSKLFFYNNNLFILFVLFSDERRLDVIKEHNGLKYPSYE